MPGVEPSEGLVFVVRPVMSPQLAGYSNGPCLSQGKCGLGGRSELTFFIMS